MLIMGVKKIEGYFKEKGKELGELVDRKQEAYGDSVTKIAL